MSGRLSELAAPAEESPESQVVQTERSALLRDCLRAALIRREVRILAMRYWLDMSFIDIGKVLHITETGAWMAHARILRRLRREIAQRGIKSLHEL